MSKIGNESKNSDWIRRNTSDEPRLSELVEMYEELGFEVKIKDFDPGELHEDCGECMAANPGKYKVIYTRKMS
jgi:hypothetical protein